MSLGRVNARAVSDWGWRGGGAGSKQVSWRYLAHIEMSEGVVIEVSAGSLCGAGQGVLWGNWIVTVVAVM